MPPRERVKGGSRPARSRDLTRNHLRWSPFLLAASSLRGVRLTLYRAKERGRQVLPPSFPSATLEIYYADSRGAAVGRGEAIPKKGQDGGLRKFKTLFTLRAERLFAILCLLPSPLPLPMSTRRMYAQDLYSLFGAYLFIRTRVAWSARKTLGR